MTWTDHWLYHVTLIGLATPTVLRLVAHGVALLWEVAVAIPRKARLLFFYVASAWFGAQFVPKGVDTVASSFLGRLYLSSREMMRANKYRGRWTDLWQWVGNTRTVKAWDGRLYQFPKLPWDKVDKRTENTP